MNLSMVEMIMEGVVRKNSTIKRSKLMEAHRSHHFNPRTERFFLEKEVKIKKDIKTSSRHLVLKKDIYPICQVTGGTAFSKLSFQNYITKNYTSSSCY